MRSKKGIYIRALEFASERDTFTIQELSKALKLTDEQKYRMATQVWEKEIFHHNRSNYMGEYEEKEINLSMSVEDEFRLLEYIELHEARASSKHATYFATAALIVSIIATVFSMIQ